MACFFSEKIKASAVRIASFSTSRRRFLVPLVAVIVAKITSAVLLFDFLNIASGETFWMSVPPGSDGQNLVFTSLATQGIRWPFTFLGWDSAWYLSISTKSYAFSNQSFAFFPGLPIFSSLLSPVFGNLAFAMVVFSFIVGILWIPVYQMVAEHYSDKPTALRSTVFFAFLPYVFLFSSVAYAEGLWLLFTLLAWLFFMKNKLLASAIATSGAAIARPPGIVILVPIIAALFYARHRNRSSFRVRNLSYFVIPTVSYLAWLLYGRLYSGSWFAIGTRTDWTSLYSFHVFAFQILPNGGLNALVSKLSERGFISVAWLLFLLAIPALFYFAFKTDKFLALYSLLFVLAILEGGAMDSIPRFISFIFPLWLAAGTKLLSNRKTSYVLPTLIGLFLTIGIVLWINFLNGVFVA